MDVPPLDADDLWVVRQAALRCLAVEDLDDLAATCVEAVGSMVDADRVRLVEVTPAGEVVVTGGDAAGVAWEAVPAAGDGPADLGDAVPHRHLLAMVVPTSSSRRVWVEVERATPGFGERDRHLLHCLQVHLAAAVDRAVLVTSLRETVEATAGPTVTVDRDGEVRHVTESASAILDRHLGEAPALGEPLPDGLRDLVGGGRTADVPLAGEAPVAVLVEAVSAPNVDVLQVREVSGEAPIGVLQRELGLSSRQAEVLLLISEGATDRQVATRLAISTHTVRKHLDMIFRRIDVPNRTMAAQACQSVLGPTRA